jgi:hypothetical protein
MPAISGHSAEDLRLSLNQNHRYLLQQQSAHFSFVWAFNEILQELAMTS